MKPRNDNTTRLRALAPFRAKLEAPGVEFGHWAETSGSLMPEYERSAVASDFVSTCNKAGWIGRDFAATEWKSWVDWKGSDEARRLSDPETLRSATAEQIGRLLTVLVRQDRFIEGSLPGDFASGYLLAILRRVEELAADFGGPN